MKKQKPTEPEKVFSPEHIRYVKRLNAKKWSILGAQIGILVLILFLWELLTFFDILDPFMFSSPSRIVLMLGNLFGSGEIWLHSGTTLLECVLGFVISMIIGIVIAILLWWNDSFRKICDPYIVVLNSLPKVALSPILLVAFGIGLKSTVAMCVLISVVVTILSVLNGFLSCDPDKILLLKSMGATKWQILCKLILPYALPHMIAALKMNIGLSWVGTIMGEYLSSKAGLGYLIMYGGSTFDLTLVMTAIVILCFMATLMYVLVSLVERFINSRR